MYWSCSVMVACSTKGDPDKDPNSKSFSQSSVKGTVRGSIPGNSTILLESVFQVNTAMNRFYLEFQNDTCTSNLEFEVYDTPIANKWYQELSYIIGLGSNIREPERMYGFNNSNWNEQYIIDKINQAIIKINEWRPIIDIQATSNASNDLCNRLHKFFEMMRGGALTPSEIYLAAPNDIKKTIEDYNVWIHTLEDFLRFNKPRLVVTFDNFRRHMLADDDYNYFSLDTKFGEVYVNYCEVGKTLFDVFEDQDDIVGDDNIRPLKYYSAEMSIYFFNSSLTTIMPQFWDWWDKNILHLESLGFVKNDKKLAIGKIPVAKLVTNEPNNIILNDISKFTHMSRVYI